MGERSRGVGCFRSRDLAEGGLEIEVRTGDPALGSDPVNTAGG